MKTIDFISLGCSKNLVDSEMLMGLFEKAGYGVTHDSDDPQGEIVVVNTCGFIADAKEESINTILEQVQAKNEGRIERLYVMGCLAERYLADLEKEIPEVDGWYGKFNYRQLLEDQIQLDGLPEPNQPAHAARHITTPRHYAYLKISEGCDRHCAYCAIPLITGHHQSRPMEDILGEVRHLAGQGVKEFQVIAQELTYYGIDLYGEQRIAQLVEQMADIEGVEWIRLHYLYPTDFPLGILDVMNRHDNVCNYLDIALQHISDKVLSPMNRKISKEDTLRLLQIIREKVPGINIRTTVMTGFPGEDDGAFEELLDFVKTQRFERLGGFSYSEEEDTMAAKTLNDNIPQEVKERRLEEIMDLQQEISLERNLDLVGKTLKVLIEENDGPMAIGRTEYDSPEVDQEVYVANCKARPGEFIMVKIQEAGPYELKGTEVK